MKNHIIKLVKKKIMLEKTGKIIQAEKVYGELMKYCNDNNINFSNAVNGAYNHLKKNDLALSLNGYL